MPLKEITITCPDDYWRVVKFMGDFKDQATALKDNWEILDMGYNESSNQLWISFENNFSYGEKNGFIYTDPDTGRELVFGFEPNLMQEFDKEKYKLEQEMERLWEEYS